jgi:hypothetical protein
MTRRPVLQGLSATGRRSHVRYYEGHARAQLEISSLSGAVQPPSYAGRVVWCFVWLVIVCGLFSFAAMPFLIAALMLLG